MTAERCIEFKIWYRPQFLNNVCHVCKSPPTDESVACPNCKLVSYCGPEHSEDDLDDHEEICEALQGAAAVMGTSRAHDKAYLLGPEQWREFRLGLITLCSKHLGRPLSPWELEVCLFPPLCSTCHKYCSTAERCSDCHITSWCTPQHRNKNHGDHCRQLSLYRELLQRKVHVIKAPVLTSKPSTMKTLLPESGRDEVSFSLLTEIATSPLTMLHHMPDTETAVVHIVGPEPHFEANNLAKWEVFMFNLCPSIKNLSLDFVGPEIGPLPLRTSTKNGRTLTFTFHQLLYHDFARKQSDTPPTLICALNPGLYRTQGFNGQDTWGPTINAMFKHSNVPVIVTAYTKKEVGMDHERIKRQIPHVTTIIPPSSNPFSSLRPLMNFVSDECTPVVFKNAFYSVLSV